MLPIVRLAVSVTVRFAVMSMVLKEAVESLPCATVAGPTTAPWFAAFQLALPSRSTCRWRREAGLIATVLPITAVAVAIAAASHAR